MGLFKKKKIIQVIESEPPPVPKTVKQPKVERHYRKLYHKKTYADNLSGKHPPRSMTETENEFYLIKPNLQYWVNLGEL